MRVCGGSLGSGGVEMIGKIRIQILTAIILLGAITGYAIFADMVEVATSTIAGMTALGMKVLEND